MPGWRNWQPRDLQTVVGTFSLASSTLAPGTKPVPRKENVMLATSVLSDRVLVLNKSWIPVNVATVKRALTMVLSETAKIVDPEDYTIHDFESWVEASRAAKEGRLVIASRFSFKARFVRATQGWTRRFRAAATISLAASA